MGERYKDRTKDAFYWVMKKIAEGHSEYGVFGEAVDYSCIIRAYELFRKNFPECKLECKEEANKSILSAISKMRSYLENKALHDKNLYGKDKNDPIRILSSLWVLDNIPFLKTDIIKDVLQSIISSEKEGGIPFWVEPWPKGRKKLYCLISNNLSNKPDLGLTVSLVNILCRDSTISACGEDFYGRHAKKYFDWLIKTYKTEESFYGTNARQWSYFLSLWCLCVVR